MKYVRAVIGIFLLICLDQYTKYIVASHLDLYTYQPVFGDLFGLFYLENRGMAWGLFQNRQVFFLCLTIIILVFLAYCYKKMMSDTKFLPLRLCIQFLAAGAIGNMIDRVFHGDILFQGAVVDFLYIKIIDFPVFNVADVYVTFSIAIIGLLLLFRYQEADFEGLFFFTRRKKKEALPEKGEMLQTEVPEENQQESSPDSNPEPIDINRFFVDEEEEDE